MIRLVKLLRLMRLDRLFERYKDDLFFFLRILTVVRLTVMLVYLGHLFGCLFFYFSNPAFHTAAEKALAEHGDLYTWVLPALVTERESGSNPTLRGFPAARVEGSRASPPHRRREDGLTHPADTSRFNLADALGLLSR